MKTSKTSSPFSAESTSRLAFIRLGELQDALLHLQHDLDQEPPENSFTEGTRLLPLHTKLTELRTMLVKEVPPESTKTLANGIVIELPFFRGKNPIPSFALLVGHAYEQKPLGSTEFKSPLEELSVWLIPYSIAKLSTSSRVGYFSTPSGGDEDLLSCTLEESEGFSARDLEACKIECPRLADILSFSKPNELFYLRLMSSNIASGTVVAFPGLIRLIGYVVAKLAGPVLGKPSVNRKNAQNTQEVPHYDFNTTRFRAFKERLVSNVNYILEWLYPENAAMQDRFMGGALPEETEKSKSTPDIALSLVDCAQMHFGTHVFEIDELVPLEDLTLIAKLDGECQSAAHSALKTPVREIERMELELWFEPDEPNWFKAKVNVAFSKVYGKTYNLVVNVAPADSVSKFSGRPNYEVQTRLCHEPEMAFRDKAQAKEKVSSLNAMTGFDQDEAFYILAAPCFDAHELVEFLREDPQQYLGVELKENLKAD